MGRPLKIIDVPSEDRQELKGWLRAGKTSQRMALRARIVLLTGEGESVEQVMKELGIARTTAYKWREK